MAEFNNLAENLTLIGVLLAAIVILWRMTTHYWQKNMDDIEAANKNTKEAHEQTVDLLKEQNSELSRRNDLLVGRVKEDKEALVAEMKHHYEQINSITLGYQSALSTFEQNMAIMNSTLHDVKETMQSQTAILKEISNVPTQLQEIKSSVEDLRKDVDDLKITKIGAYANG